MNLELNTKEVAVLKQAIETLNDMTTDMLFEDTTVSLYPRGEETVTLTKETATALRNELRDQFERVSAIRSVMTKIGSKYNESGYSV